MGLEISRATGSYSADNRNRTSSRGQLSWPDQATQPWWTRASEKHALKGLRDHEELGTVDEEEKKKPEDRGLEKWNGDHGEGGIGDHELNRRASRLKGRESGKIKTGGGEIEWNGRENRHGGV